jgi:ATPase subunit of ABC transporter with duplicated ATPase domains
MIAFSGVHKSFGGQVLFEDLNFAVNRGEKVGLVGRNGHGKSTLFQMILGNTDLDSGTLSIPKNYRIGHLQQHLHFTESTVLDECCLGCLLKTNTKPGRSSACCRAWDFRRTTCTARPKNFQAATRSA